MTNQKPTRPLALSVVAGLVFVEGAFVLGLAAVLGFEILMGSSRAISTALALFAMVAAAGAFVVFIGVSLRRSKRWSRSAALFWQLVQLSVATGSFSGQFGNWMIGTALIVPSLVVAVLLFRKDVVAATMEAVDRDE